MLSNPRKNLESGRSGKTHYEKTMTKIGIYIPPIYYVFYMLYALKHYVSEAFMLFAPERNTRKTLEKIRVFV
jgi:hypothetical protein